MDNGLTTIEEAREFYNDLYDDDASIYSQVELKCWINHSESRHRNGNPPFTYYNYIHHMNARAYIEQIEFDIINVDDIGGKEKVIKFLKENAQ